MPGAKSRLLQVTHVVTGRRDQRAGPDRAHPSVATGARWVPWALACTPGWAGEVQPWTDVVHLHVFAEAGTGAPEFEPTVAWVQQLAAHRLPLVLTVHDLDAPSLPDQRVLDVLVAEATALLVGSPGCAEQVTLRWRRAAVVVPLGSDPAGTATRRSVQAGIYAGCASHD